MLATMYRVYYKCISILLMRNVGMSTLFCSCCLDDKKLVRVVDVC